MLSGRRADTTSKMPQKLDQEIISGVTGAVVLVSSVVGLGLPILVGIGAGVGVFFGVRLILSDKNSKILPRMESNVRGMIDEGRDQLNLLRAQSAQPFVPQDIKLRAEKIIGIGEAIMGQIEEKPSKAQGANRFFTYYLDAAVQIVDKYADLAKVEITNDGQEELGQKARHALEMIERAFTKQQKHLMQNDVFDLDNEIALLEQTLKMDGLDVKGKNSG